MQPVIIRRTPMVLVRMLIQIEALALVTFALTAKLGNYEYDLYPLLSLEKVISFQTAKFIILSGAQFCITLYALMRWYREMYTVHGNTILHRTGALQRKEKKFTADPAATFELFPQNIFAKHFRYGEIRVTNSSGEVLVMRDIPHPEQFIEAIGQNNREEIELAELLKQEENGELEFKSSLRFDFEINRPSRNLERSVMKTIAAFLNSRGGYCVIGVDDRRQPLGLHHDYQTLQRKDRDGFENHFTQTFNAMIGPEFRSLIDLQFKTIEGKEVCRVHVRPSPRPVYFKFDQHEHFFMRTGNITASLKLSEMESYARTRWPHNRHPA